MKKIIFVIFAMAIALSAHAQFTGSSSSSSFGRSGASGSFSTYVKAGLSLNGCSLSGTAVDQAKQSGVNFTSGTIAGYNAVFGCHLYENQGFYYGMECGLGTRGMNLLVTELSEAMVESTILSLHGFKASPVILGYLFQFNDFLALDAHIGAYLSYDYAGKSISTVTYSGSTHTSTSDLSDAKNLNRFDVGVHPGVTLWIGRFGVDFSYQRGFINFIKDGNTNGVEFNSKNIILGVAYRFL